MFRDSGEPIMVRNSVDFRLAQIQILEELKDGVGSELSEQMTNTQHALLDEAHRLDDKRRRLPPGDDCWHEANNTSKDPKVRKRAQRMYDMYTWNY